MKGNPLELINARRGLMLDGAAERAKAIVRRNAAKQAAIERLINRYSNSGDVILDPFGGLMTVPTLAVKHGRFGIGVELNADYFRDGVGYLKAADEEIAVPTLFDFL